MRIFIWGQEKSISSQWKLNRIH